MPYSHPQSELVFIPHWTNPSDPGAGTNLSISVPTAGQIELILLSFLFTTDANPANRSLRVSLETGGNSIWLAASSFAQTASQVFGYVCHQNPATNRPSPLDYIFLGLPNLRIIDNTATIDVTVNGIQATDAISDIYAYWKLWRGVG